jgi:hypothetical protein
LTTGRWTHEENGMRGKGNIYGILWSGILCLGLLVQPLWAGAAESQPTVAALDRIEVLDLKTATRIALSENPSLAAARARVEQAGQIVKQAQAGVLAPFGSVCRGIAGGAV